MIGLSPFFPTVSPAHLSHILLLDQMGIVAASRVGHSLPISTWGKEAKKEKKEKKRATSGEVPIFPSRGAQQALLSPYCKGFLNIGKTGVRVLVAAVEPWCRIALTRKSYSGRKSKKNDHKYDIFENRKATVLNFRADT